MFKYKCKRCVASLLLAVLVSGLFSPLTAYADTETKPAPGGASHRHNETGAGTVVGNTTNIVKELTETALATKPDPNGGTSGSASSTTPTYNESTSGSSDNAESSSSSDRGGCISDTSSIPDTRQAANLMYAVDYMINHWADHENSDYSDTVNDSDVALAYRINDEILLSEQSQNTSIYNEYNGWISGTANFTSDTFNEWFNKVADIAGEEDRVDIGFMTQDDPLLVIYEHLSNYLTGDVTYMSDGTLGHYILMSFVVLTNPELFNTEESVQTFSQYAGPALTRPQNEDRPLWDVLSKNYGMSNNSTDYCVDEADHVYNPKNLGILYFGSGGDVDDISATEGADVLAKYALVNCVLQYNQIILKIQYAAQSNTLNSPEAQTLMQLAKQYDSIFSGILPYIHRMFNFPIYQDKSASDLCDMHNISTDVEDFVNSLTSHNYTSSLKDDTPFDLFYTLNSDTPVVSVDRETILNDVVVNTSYDDKLAELIDKQHHYSSINDDPMMFFEENQLTLNNEALSGMSMPVNQLATNMTSIPSTSGDPVDETGNAVSSSAVTINKWIQEGMSYSATYIPMRTNIYDASTHGSWSDDF